MLGEFETDPSTGEVKFRGVWYDSMEEAEEEKSKRDDAMVEMIESLQDY